MKSVTAYFQVIISSLFCVFYRKIRILLLKGGDHSQIDGAMFFQASALPDRITSDVFEK
jgi:hypothetical protein